MTNLQSNHGLQARQEKIQAKRKQTSRRDFVMEIASWYPNNFYKIDWKITRFPLGKYYRNVQ